MKNQKGFSVVSLVVVVAVVAIGVGAYFYLRTIVQENHMKVTSTLPVTNDSKNTTQTTSTFNDSDMRISASRIPASKNSAPIFNDANSDITSKADLDFLTKSFTNFSPKSLPPVAESQKILTTYSKLLTIFDENAYRQYQCLPTLGDACPLQPVRHIGNLASLRATTLLEQNKLTQAQISASSVVALGKNITADADGIITLLVGWSLQNQGYTILGMIKPKTTISEADKKVLISNLRKEHKNALRYMYTETAQAMDYITSAANKPSRPYIDNEEEEIATYRKEAAASKTAWNPNETKKYFYDSYKIAVSNVDLVCGATPANSRIDIHFNPEDKQTENYVGKTLYAGMYASFDTITQKRCAIESLIQAL